jgi:hypothetical protein
MPVIGWVALGIAAVVGLVIATTPAKKLAAPDTKDLCLAALPEPFKADAQKIVTGGDDARMDSFAAQADSLGWHCAAKELRALAKECRRRKGLMPQLSEADTKKEMPPELLKEFEAILAKIATLGIPIGTGKGDVKAVAKEVEAFGEKLKSLCYDKAGEAGKEIAKNLRDAPAPTAELETPSIISTTTTTLEAPAESLTDAIALARSYAKMLPDTWKYGDIGPMATTPSPGGGTLPANPRVYIDMVLNNVEKKLLYTTGVYAASDYIRKNRDAGGANADAHTNLANKLDEIAKSMPRPPGGFGS